MKFALGLVVFVGVAGLCSQAAVTIKETKLELAKGSIILKAGSEVDVVSDDGEVATVIYRKLQGRIPLTALNAGSEPSEAAARVAPLPPPPRRPQQPERTAAELALAKQMKEAGAQLAPALAAAEALNIEGRIDEANAGILATFPEKTRTAAEAFVLGNILFPMLPKASYQLHKQAAAAYPGISDVLFEWAMEQHRAKEYAAAAQTYAAFSKLRPNNALAYGLAAECAIRAGDLPKAMALWQSSKDATVGTLERFETLVCEINGGLFNDDLRAGLMRRVRKGDEKAATEMILLDTAWRLDWWNVKPSLPRLKHDLALVKRSFPQPGLELRAALCIAECVRGIAPESPADLTAQFAAAGFMFDDAQTLPTNGKALSQMLLLAFAHTPLKREQARIRFGERVLAMARTSNDVEMYNVAAGLYEKSDRLPEIDQEGWDATHDPRFAASRLAGLVAKKKLTLNDPLVVRALKEFPQDSEVAHLVMILAVADLMAGVKAPSKLPDPQASQQFVQRYLVPAIKAEYTKLSSTRPGADLPRPSAYVLQSYFTFLSYLQAK